MKQALLILALAVLFACTTEPDDSGPVVYTGKIAAMDLISHTYMVDGVPVTEYIMQNYASIHTPALRSTSTVVAECQGMVDTTQWFADSVYYAIAFPDSGIVRLYPYSRGCQLGGGYRITVTN